MIQCSISNYCVPTYNSSETIGRKNDPKVIHVVLQNLMNLMNVDRGGGILEYTNRQHWEVKTEL